MWRYADATPPLARLLCCHTGEAQARFTPDGSEVVTAGAGDGQLLRWRAGDGRPLGALLDDPRPVRGSGFAGRNVAFSNDGDIVAVGQADGTVDLWNRTAGRLVTSIPTGQRGGQIRVDWSPTESLLATTAPDRSVVLWDVSDLHEPTASARVQLGDDPGEISSFPTFSPDGRILVVANSKIVGATLTFIDAADGRVQRQVHRADNLGDVAFSVDSGTLAVGGGLGAALIDVASGETIATRVTDGTSSIAYAHGGRWLVTVGWPTEALPQLIPQGATSEPTTPPSATLAVWDAESLRQIGKPITVVGPFPFDASANPDGTKVVTSEFVVSSSPVDTAPILWELDPERWAELAVRSPVATSPATNGPTTCPAATTAPPANSGRSTREGSSEKNRGVRLTETELVDLGLHDPSAPDAAQRLTLLRLVLEHGASVDEVRFALAQHRLHTLAGERVVVGATKRATLQEMAANAGVDVEFSEHLWRALGFADPGVEPLVCSEADENVLALFSVLADMFDRDTALQIARTAGASLARHGGRGHRRGASPGGSADACQGRRRRGRRSNVRDAGHRPGTPAVPDDRSGPSTSPRASGSALHALGIRCERDEHGVRRRGVRRPRRLHGPYAVAFTRGAR